MQTEPYRTPSIVKNSPAQNLLLASENPAMIQILNTGGTDEVGKVIGETENVRESEAAELDCILQTSEEL